MLGTKRAATRGAIAGFVLVGSWISSSSRAQAQCEGPQSTVECPCGQPGLDDSVAFECVPAEASVPYYSSIGLPHDGRLQYFLPSQPPSSADGYPVVMMFHGGAGVERLYEAPSEGGWGARTIRALLGAGYAVLVPHAPLINWQTNWPHVVAGTPYELIRDYRYLDKLIRVVRDPSLLAGSEHAELRQTLAQLDGENLFATGLSDGGAQASRMARSWLDEDGRSIFKAIVLNAGSWSTCAASGIIPPTWVCNPSDITYQHSPVLLLHAQADTVVGVDHADLYARELEQARTRTDDPIVIEWRALIARERDNGATPMNLLDYASCTDPDDRFCVSYDARLIPSRGHRFLNEAPEEHVRWFDHYLEQ